MLLTPREHVLIGGSPKPAYNLVQPEEAYRERFDTPVILIERGADPDLIRAVNEGRARLDKQGGPATFLMFDLKGAVQAEFNLEPLDEEGKVSGKTRLAFVKYSDGRVVDDPEQLKEIGLSAAGEQMLKQEFPSLREKRREEKISRR